MAQIGVYRAAEGEYLDLSDKEQANWAREHYPAIMADRAVGMSEQYQFMPSWRIAERLDRQFGMRLVEVGQQFSRSRNPAGQEHIMKFRFPSSLVKLDKVGDSAPELVVLNSHNGRSTIRAYAGVFRLVCANGMVVSERSFGHIKLRHFGEANSFDEFGRLLDVLANRMVALDERMALMREVTLTRNQQRQLAEELIKRRGSPDWLKPDMVLSARRPEDDVDETGQRSLWLTFNVLQENLTKGDISDDPQAGRRRRSIRAITGARAHVLTNEAIWAGLEDFIEDGFPKVASKVFEPVDAQAPVLVPVAPIEDAEVMPVEAPRQPEGGDEPEAPQAGQEAGKLEAAEPQPLTEQEFDALLKEATYEELEALTELQKSSLTAGQRKKLSSRKSYLKRK